MKTLVEKPLIIAHKGASAYAPENTLEAFELAARMGADGVELDVYLTYDGEVVVCHSQKIDGVSNGQGIIPEYTLSELKIFDFGYHFYDHQRKGIRIPTLDEVYELLAPLGLIVNVEIKSHNPDIVQACDRVARKYRMSEKVIYSSFDHLQLQRVRESIQGAFIAPLYYSNICEPWSYGMGMGAKATHPPYEWITQYEGYVEKCHERGLRVHPWTVDKEEDIKMLIDAGVDAIITNYPDIALKIRDNK